MKDSFRHKGLRQKLIETLREKGITNEEVLDANPIALFTLRKKYLVIIHFLGGSAKLYVLRVDIFLMKVYQTLVFINR